MSAPISCAGCSTTACGSGCCCETRTTTRDWKASTSSARSGTSGTWRPQGRRFLGAGASITVLPTSRPSKATARIDGTYSSAMFSVPATCCRRPGRRKPAGWWLRARSARSVTIWTIPPRPATRPCSSIPWSARCPTSAANRSSSRSAGAPRQRARMSWSQPVVRWWEAPTSSRRGWEEPSATTPTASSAPMSMAGSSSSPHATLSKGICCACATAARAKSTSSAASTRPFRISSTCTKRSRASRGRAGGVCPVSCVSSAVGVALSGLS